MLNIITIYTHIERHPTPHYCISTIHQSQLSPNTQSPSFKTSRVGTKMRTVQSLLILVLIIVGIETHKIFVFSLLSLLQKNLLTAGILIPQVFLRWVALTVVAGRRARISKDCVLSLCSPSAQAHAARSSTPKPLASARKARACATTARKQYLSKIFPVCLDRNNGTIKYNRVKKIDQN
jgi:hypothetical protein